VTISSYRFRPSNGALAWLKPIYDRWLAWKTTVDLTGKRYVEVRAEDLAANWPEQRPPAAFSSPGPVVIGASPQHDAGQR
jgi:hypothetical protein